MLKFENILIASVAILFILNGCASITRGLSEPVAFESEPEGASVELNDGQTCISTPCTIDMNRETTEVATFRKDGCETKSTSINNRVSSIGSWMLGGNLVLGFVISGLAYSAFDDEVVGFIEDWLIVAAVGLGIDFATGAGREVFPNPIKVQLEC